MIDKFLGEFAKLIAANPDSIRTEKKEVDPTFCEIVIYADKEDTGRLIGKNGKMINSLKTLISGCKAKDGVSYRVTVRANEE